MRLNRARVGFGDLIDHGVVSQIGLDGEQSSPLSLLARVRGKRLQRLTIAIDAGDLDARRQQAPRYCPADAACCTGHVTTATLWVSVIAWFLPLRVSPSYFRFGARVSERPFRRRVRRYLGESHISAAPPMLDQLDAGDVLLVMRLDRPARSTATFSIPLRRSPAREPGSVSLARRRVGRHLDAQRCSLCSRRPCRVLA